MLRRFISWRLAAAEKLLGASLDYVREILRTSLRAFFTFMKIMPIASYRRALPLAPFHVAKLVATRDEDCGTCVQAVVNIAKSEGVDREVLRACLRSAPEELGADLADVYTFTEHVVKATGGEDEYRERIRGRYGDAALVELAMAIAMCRVYPITKRALGYAKSCALVKVDA